MNKGKLPKPSDTRRIILGVDYDPDNESPSSYKGVYLQYPTNEMKLANQFGMFNVKISTGDTKIDMIAAYLIKKHFNFEKTSVSSSYDDWCEIVDKDPAYIIRERKPAEIKRAANWIKNNFNLSVDMAP